ncbi:helix-turn-helix domain-containing protein [Paenibacillus sp. HW567]|uniref:helix-turn-helix domain-containing protein n=1 Tax=Paenibacillus sp. HW567 TaxID=1034769 RepID=UPI00036DC68D|nr:AraC family transcriptional regulator [Paenibacillus sp. HW567]
MMNYENTAASWSQKKHGPIQPDIMNQSYYRECIIPWNSTTNKGSALFYEFKTAESLNRPILMVPDTCMDMIVECDPVVPRAFFLGPSFKLRYLDLKPDTIYFGFKPYTEKGMIKSLVYHYKDLAGDRVDLQELINIEDLCETLIEGISFRERASIFKSFAQKHFINYDYKSDFIENLLCLLCGHTDELSLSEMFTKIGYSARHCRQVFSDSYGIPPKQYCRIMRFQNAISCFSHPSSTLSTDFNYLLSQNYYDQSHSIRDFKTFTSMPPAAFKKYILNQ